MNANQQAILEDERAAERIYRDRRAKKVNRVRPAFSSPRNSQWTGNGVVHTPKVDAGELVGRVSLITPHKLINNRTDYYIGTWHDEIEGTQVLSWAAPVACTYYRGTNHHQFCELVGAIRAFRHEGSKLVSYEDDILQDSANNDPFPRRGFRVPDAPSVHRTLPVSGLKPKPLASNTVSTPSSAPVSQPDPAVSGVRAEKLLREVLVAPRTAQLSPLLATLQPDQYELVTTPASESMVIEGQPGTGKTIIAAHRAAWLVNPDMTKETPENAQIGDVLIVGPSQDYSHHIIRIINQLTDSSNRERIKVHSLPSLMRKLANLQETPPDGESQSEADVSAKLAEIAWEAADRANRQFKELGSKARVEDAYHMLRTNQGLHGRPITGEQEWEEYLSELPDYQTAREETRLIPLLALLGWWLTQTPTLRNIRHIIVDESQDISAIEWRLLREMNYNGSWTIIGDLNQRRSQETPTDWDTILETLNLDSSLVPTLPLERGYRSTKPILEFANRLLPRVDRRILAFQQDGPQPIMEHALSQSAIISKTYEHIVRLLAKYPQGTIAVITVNPWKIRDYLRKGGWHAISRTSTNGSTFLDEHVWENERGNHRVNTLTPDEARGLEFDAVVVVEPSEFPSPGSLQGSLYTALTRANRELAIVYRQALPDELKGYKRSAVPAVTQNSESVSTPPTTEGIANPEVMANPITESVKPSPPAKPEEIAIRKKHGLGTSLSSLMPKESQTAVPERPILKSEPTEEWLSIASLLADPSGIKTIASISSLPVSQQDAAAMKVAKAVRSFLELRGVAPDLRHFQLKEWQALVHRVCALLQQNASGVNPIPAWTAGSKQGSSGRNPRLTVQASIAEHAFPITNAVQFHATWRESKHLPFADRKAVRIAAFGHDTTGLMESEAAARLGVDFTDSSNQWKVCGICKGHGKHN